MRNGLWTRGACISFQGRKYETKPSLIGARVDIAYDPVCPESITVSCPGMEPFTTGPVKIGAFCGKNPALPVSMQEAQAENSRMLAALEEKREQSREKMTDAISFGQFRKDGGAHV